MMNILQSLNNKLVSTVSTNYFRYFFSELNTNVKVIGIVGERGIGKTTSLLQYANSHRHSFYISADNTLIQGYGLFRIAYDLFTDYGIETLIIDEIHIYQNWIGELKNIIDSFPEKKIIFSGSSSLDIVAGTGSLERRVKVIQVFPLNFCEFMKIQYAIELPSISFDDLIKNYKRMSFELSSVVEQKHIKHFFEMGFYPYSKDFEREDFYLKIYNTLEKVILEDLPSYLNFQTSTLIKIKKIFYFIAHTQPGDLNYSSLAKKVGVHSDTLENILFILSKIGIIHLIPKSVGLSDLLRKEFKVYLGNPNLYFSFDANISLGTLREAFVIHFLKRLIRPQMEFQTILSLPTNGDLNFFFKDTHYLFEIGGKNKTKKQISQKENAFVISDELIVGTQNKIPLWMFGLLQGD